MKKDEVDLAWAYMVCAAKMLEERIIPEYGIAVMQQIVATVSFKNDVKEESK